MKYRTLGKTGLNVSEVGVGAWAFGGPFIVNGIQAGWAGQKDEDSVRVIQAAADAGINFIDTADVYGLGHSEEIIGQAIRGRRDHWVIATKFGHAPFDKHRFKSAYDAANIRACCEASLKRLGVETIDLYQLHGPADLGFEQETIETIRALRKAGKIKHIGFSFYMQRELDAMLQATLPFETIQVEFNLRWTYTRAHGIFERARKENWGVIVKSPLHGSLLTGKHTAETQFGPDDLRGDPKGVAKHFSDRKKYLRNLEFVDKLRFLETPGRTLAQAALRYVLDEPAVSTIIPGARRTEHLTPNAAAADLNPLTSEEHRRIAEVQAGYQTEDGW
ncbi:MAG TPA: aldo/keto reductase [Planctomycetota bacterium]|nr:aldo/keto reductase [Planctomycetota bacterium]